MSAAKFQQNLRQPPPPHRTRRGRSAGPATLQAPPSVPRSECSFTHFIVAAVSRSYRYLVSFGEKKHCKRDWHKRINSVNAMDWN